MDMLPNMVPPAGGLPPGLMPMGARAPANVGNVTVPSVNAGNQVAAHAAIKNAAELLQQALLQLPMGSEQHTKLLDIVKKLSGIASEGQTDPSAQIQSLVQAARAAAQRGVPGLPGVMPATQPPPPAPAPAESGQPA